MLLPQETEPQMVVPLLPQPSQFNILKFNLKKSVSRYTIYKLDHLLFTLKPTFTLKPVLPLLPQPWVSPTIVTNLL
jgi:hypothetical protein